MKPQSSIPAASTNIASTRLSSIGPLPLWGDTSAYQALQKRYNGRLSSARHRPGLIQRKAAICRRHSLNCTGYSQSGVSK